MNQATLNIGLVGHVAHGKSTLTHAITGVTTPKFKQEKERNITIKLGYANAKIYHCSHCRQYTSSSSDGPLTLPCPACQQSADCVRHVSFVDVPGHSQLMATMLNGVAIMDAALLVIAANEPCPQPQTEEHLASLTTSQVVIVQNKVDTIAQGVCMDHYNQIRQFIRGSSIADCPIIPISAQRQLNISLVLEEMMKFPLPQRDITSPARMMIVRSFDVNRPGTLPTSLVGGIAGGAILRGQLKIGDTIEIRPGIMTQAKDHSLAAQPLLTTVRTLCAETNVLEMAEPGGLIGVGTDIDPSLCRGDRLVGQVLGAVGSLPPVFSHLEMSVRLKKKVAALSTGETLLIHAMSNAIESRVMACHVDLCKLKLQRPLCCDLGSKVAISRKVSGQWRLMGVGQVLHGKVLVA